MDKNIEIIIKLLNNANDEYNNIPGNQLGMPSHLMNVARLFGEASEKVTYLEKKCLKESSRWMKSIYEYGHNNNNNNNNNNTRKHKKIMPKHNKI